MDRVAGHIPRQELRAWTCRPTQVRELCTERARHARRPARGRPGGGRARRARQGRRATSRVRSAAGSRAIDKAKTWNVPSFERVMAGWTPTSRTDARTCLIHNDFRLDNVVLDHDDPTQADRRAGLGDGDPRRPADGPRQRARYWVEADDDRLLPAVPDAADHVPGMLTRARGGRLLLRADRHRATDESGRSTRSSACSGWP